MFVTTTCRCCGANATAARIGEHIVAPGGLLEVSGHRLHDWAPVSAAYLPISHAEHVDDPGLLA